MAVQEALPTLMAALKQIYTLSRHYGTPARMTGLFLRMTNEIIVCCKRFLNGGKVANPGRMWAHNPSELIGHYKCVVIFFFFCHFFFVLFSKSVYLVRRCVGLQ
jgi:dynein heavy chain